MRCFLGKYSLKAVKIKDCEIRWESSKTFQKRHYQNLECFNIVNIVNTRVAKIIKYQPHGGSNHLSVKSIKIEKERGAGHIKLF